MVSVQIAPSESGWTGRVTVTDRGSTTHHTVRVSRGDLERWSRGTDPADLVRRSFAFLLEREPKESILSAFDLAVIPRYFPEYADAMRTGPAD